MDHNELIKEVLKKITPTREEREEIKRVERELLGKLSIPGVELRLLGSVAKDTFLRGEHDLDIFAFFPREVDKDKAAFQIFKILEKEGISYEKRYSEHPYAKIHYKNIEADIVPAYKIKKGERIISAVDRTPLHYEFVKSNLKEEQKGEVRLLKKLLKNFGIYGAEVGIKGFSGYLCELLIIKYGSFFSLLKEAASWKIPVKISFNNDDFSLFDDPLVFIDPTDRYRNVASPLSKENLSKFIAISNAFLKEPSIEFFFLESTPTYDLGKFIAVEFTKPEVVEDVRHGQLMRMLSSLKRNLELKGFLVSSSFIYEDNEKSYILLSSPNELGEKEIKKGPFVWEENHVKKFLSKNKEVFLKEERFYALKKIKNRDLLSNIREFFSSYSFPSYYSKKGMKIIDRFNNGLQQRIDLEKKRYYLILRR